jgi:hypothetical protein
MAALVLPPTDVDYRRVPFGRAVINPQLTLSTAAVLLWSRPER